MKISEALKFLNENNFIIESLYGNEAKLTKLIEKIIAPLKMEKYILSGHCMTSDIIVLKKNIFSETKLTPEQLKQACETAGYYCNIHETQDVWITPKVNKQSLPAKIMPRNNKINSNYGFFHASAAPNLDKTGIRVRSRMEDEFYDIYEGRIYLSMKNEKEILTLVNMVRDEHDLSIDKVSLYEVFIPKNYEVYQDPTVTDAVYVTNSIPAKYIKKLNIREIIGKDIYDRNLEFKNMIDDMTFVEEVKALLPDFTDEHFLRQYLKKKYSIDAMYFRGKSAEDIADVLSFNL